MTGVTLKQANQIIEAAIAKARAMELPPIGVAVLDPGGHLKAMQAEDGLSFVRTQVCQAKAWGALGVGTHSRHIAARYQQDALQPGFIDALNALTGGRIIPLPGGVLIRDGGDVIVGAVGISGAKSEDDETCAAAGIEAAGFRVELTRR